MKAAKLTALLALPALGGAAPSLAPQDRDVPVVLELFTSQGGSTCPPAERLLSNWGLEVFQQGLALPLAFHVDTYDEFGWKDPFSSADFTKRQHDYDDRLEAQILTPQFVVAGKSAVLLNDRGEAAAQLRRYAGQAPAAQLSLGAPQFAKGRLKLKATARLLHPAKKDGDNYRVLALVFENGLTTRVAAGENKGQTLRNDFVVRAMKDLGALRKDDDHPWDKDADFDWDGSWAAARSGAVLLLQDQQTLELRGARLLYPLSAR